MKRLTPTILILGILGFSLLAVTGLSYAEKFDEEFLAQYKAVYLALLNTNKVAADTFKAEVMVALETMPSSNNIKKEIATKIGDKTNPRETYNIVARDREIAERERYTEGLGGSGNDSNGGSTSGSGGTTAGGKGFKQDEGAGVGSGN